MKDSRTSCGLTDSWYRMSLVHTCSSPTTHGISSVFPFRPSKAWHEEEEEVQSSSCSEPIRVHAYTSRFWPPAGSDLQQLFSFCTPLCEAQDRLVLHLHRCTGERSQPANTQTHIQLQVMPIRDFYTPAGPEREFRLSQQETCSDQRVDFTWTDLNWPWESGSWLEDVELV